MKRLRNLFERALRPPSSLAHPSVGPFAPYFDSNCFTRKGKPSAKKEKDFEGVCGENSPHTPSPQ